LQEQYVLNDNKVILLCTRIVGGSAPKIRYLVSWDEREKERNSGEKERERKGEEGRKWEGRGWG